MAFEELHRPLFSEHGSIYFANGNNPSKELNYAFCEVWLLLYKLFSFLLTHFCSTHTQTFSRVHSHTSLLAQLTPSQSHAPTQIWFLFTSASNHEHTDLHVQPRAFSRVILCLFFKRNFCNLSYENDFDLHENEPVSETHFHMKGFARRLFLTQRQKTTGKWLVTESLRHSIVVVICI